MVFAFKTLKRLLLDKFLVLSIGKYKILQKTYHLKLKLILKILVTMQITALFILNYNYVNNINSNMPYEKNDVLTHFSKFV